MTPRLKILAAFKTIRVNFSLAPSLSRSVRLVRRAILGALVQQPPNKALAGGPASLLAFLVLL